jgi:hypothetical protein
MVRTRLAVVLSFRDKPLLVAGCVLGFLAWWGELPLWATGLAALAVAVDVRLRLVNDPGL